MIIGKIVSAASHIDYLCQVYSLGEIEVPPAPADYGFGTFVAVPRGDGGHLVGVIYNTTLLNPEFGNLGPRLSPQEDLAVFSPDYLHEKVTLVAVYVLGGVDADGMATQGVPAVAAAIDAPARRLERDEIAAFHAAGSDEGSLRMAYLPSLATMNNPLAPHLALSILATLRELFPHERGRLAVLESNLSWRSRIVPVG